MGRRRGRRRHRDQKALSSVMPTCPGDTEIHGASAMLLYEAPLGIALFSFDEAYLNNPPKDFWAGIPPPTLEFFLKYERVSTPIDLTNDDIDDYLVKKLTRHCGSQKKLVVARAQHKTIIEKKLAITCLLVDVPHCEVINCSLMNPRLTSFPEEKSEMNTTDPFSTGEELITLLSQHNIDVKPGMVNEPIAELARQLHGTKLRQTEILKFLYILLNDFIVTSGIDTKRWKLFHFVTVPKMICYPESSYEIYDAYEIFLPAEYRMIEANASRYKRSFSKIGVLSFYEEVVSLYSRKCILLQTLDSLLEEAKGDMKIHEASAMLLYDAPFGITLFSFDGAYLNNSMKDFWANIPQFSLEEFIMCEKVSTLFDPDNEAIDDHLAKELTRHCGSMKKLVVGSAQRKRVIEEKLGITCLHVPELEVINCPLMSPMRTLLAQEKTETNKTDPFSMREELITFLRQHNFDIKPEMVNESIAELACQLHETKLLQMELLKFFNILLKDFIVISGIDTVNWMLFQFATVPKMICCPGSSYEIYHPDKIFSCVEYRKIEANASRYRTSFSKIGVLSVYEEVVSLHTKRCLLLHDLGSLLEKAKCEIRQSRRLQDLIDEERAREANGVTPRIPLSRRSKAMKRSICPYSYILQH